MSAQSNVVAEHKAKILEQVTAAIDALDVVRDAGDELDNLLYSVRYDDDLAPLNTDTVETAYRTLGNHIDAVGALRTALADLKDEVS